MNKEGESPTLKTKNRVSKFMCPPVSQWLILIKDIHREKALSNKSPAPKKVPMWAFGLFGTLNQLFIRGS